MAKHFSKSVQINLVLHTQVRKRSLVSMWEPYLTLDTELKTLLLVSEVAKFYVQACPCSKFISMFPFPASVRATTHF